ncbi:uncharacterized protein LOC106082234 [Stomoxys calcitrans]|uniref:uncharacterized protein LOC106082234 n=1 Tax=Stomoxys calcitrans TaxID=35570 RepID=UPI0027E2F8B3|nr:uncharacterized protein LOC106082234 [Stomoxys calcitrans]
MEHFNANLVRHFPLISLAIILSASCSSIDALASNKSENFQEFQYCLKKSTNPNLKECIGRSAINFLQRFEEKENVTLAKDFIATKGDNVASRSLVNFLDTDPVDIRGILENAGAVFSQRSLEWHMDSLYPGLMFKIGPSADANSVAQFMLDPTIDERNFNYEEPSTARILTKQYLLPFLLGLKFNLVALVPLLFAIICLLLKKSLFIAKLVVYVSSILGIGGVAGSLASVGNWGSLFGVPPLPPPIPPPHQGAHFPGAVGYFPGKHTVFSQYDQDELQHSGPYKRQDRKVIFDKPREDDSKNSVKTSSSVRQTTASPVLTTPAVDNFYNYEKQMLMQDRSERMRHSNGKLGPSAYDEDYDEVAGVINVSSNHRFKTSNDNSGWKIIRV